jgi:hypothetical protein
MSAVRGPVFLAKQSYRLRRAMDASRLLPILGFALILIPILWQPWTDDRADTARGWVYLFAVWAGLIVIAASLGRPLSRASGGGDVASPRGPVDADPDQSGRR